MKKYTLFSLVIFIALCSCEEAFIEEDLSDDMTAIIAPKDGSQIQDTSINFSWEAVDQATSYRVQIARPNFENAAQIVEDTTVTSTNFRTNLTKNTYEWRVRAQNSGSETAYVMAGFSVTEPTGFASREVLLTSPVNELATNEPEIELQWQAVPDANTYRIQLLNSSNEVMQEETTIDTMITLTFPEGVTRWQVRAENATQNTLYTTRSVTVDTTSPNTPVATTPANNAILTETAVSFAWTRETVEGTTEIDSIYIFEDEALTQLVTKNQVTSPSEITLEASTTYYWFLKAFDQAKNESDASATQNFQIN